MIPIIARPIREHQVEQQHQVEGMQEDAEDEDTHAMEDRRGGSRIVEAAALEAAEQRRLGGARADDKDTESEQPRPRKRHRQQLPNPFIDDVAGASDDDDEEEAPQTKAYDGHNSDSNGD